MTSNPISFTLFPPLELHGTACGETHIRIDPMHFDVRYCQQTFYWMTSTVEDLHGVVKLYPRIIQFDIVCITIFICINSHVYKTLH